MLISCVDIYKTASSPNMNLCAGIQSNLFVIIYVAALLVLNTIGATGLVSSTVLGSVNIAAFSPLLLCSFCYLYEACGSRIDRTTMIICSALFTAYCVALIAPNIIMLSDPTLLSVEMAGAITTTVTLAYEVALLCYKSRCSWARMIESHHDAGIRLRQDLA